MDTAPPARTDPRSPDEPGGTASDEPTVVVVDDEPDMRTLVERMLTGAGFEIVGTAGDGVTGIETVAAEQPDVVLLDLRMPRLDGAAALPAIVKQAPRTMITILSANLDGERVESLLQRGAFTAYDKGDLTRLAPHLSEDLARFRRVLDGEDDVPAWQRRYRRL